MRCETSTADLKVMNGKKHYSNSNLKTTQGEQDGGRVGGHGIHLSPWIHQEHTFRHRSARRTPAESRQEYLTRVKEYTEPCKLGRTKELEGKTVSRTGPPLSGLNN